MKKLMILGARAMQVPCIRQAKEMGFYVIAVDMNPDAIGLQYADEKVIISTLDIPAVVDAAKKIKVDGIITLCTDPAVRTVAAVGEALNIPAISVENSFKVTDKIKMRETLREHGVPVPYFCKAKNETEFYKAIREILNSGYKCIVKPADNSGSRGVILLDRYDKKSLHDAYVYSKEYSRSGDVVVEEFMEGPEVCVETLNYDGVCYPIQITDKLTTGAPYFVEMGHSQPSMLPADVQADILRVAVACNMALGNCNGSSCTEIIATKDGAKVVEMGARLAGDYMTSDLVPLSTGVNMIESIIKIAFGEKPDCEHKFEKASAIRFLVTEEGVIKSISGLKAAESVPGVIRVGIDRKIGERAVKIRNSLDRVGYVIAQADTPLNAIKVCEEAMSKIQIEIEKDC
ncbi:MAG: ATP-grasp domain-containing protein [Sphaerochaetaceae bacterium]|nr:ATP-grasp domain-containing protein [Sphaerochaetaceae bacterium]